MYIDNAVLDNKGVLQFPIGIVQKENGKICPILDRDGNIETDKKIISQHTDAILITVEPDTLQLINVGFKNQIETLAKRVNDLLNNLHKKNSIN